MGRMIALSIDLISASFICYYIGTDPLNVHGTITQDFVRGLNGQPVENTYRPQFQNLFLDCGQGGKCNE